ncbi:MAG: flippase [Flavobacteriales bacterium]|nr:flippase [Flavobacteriales bacterium]
MTPFIKKFLDRFDVHMQELLHGSAVSFVLKVVAAGAAFGLNVVLARLLGAEGSGVFYLAFTIVLVIATIGRIGMDNALVRFVAASAASEDGGRILGVYKKSLFYVLPISTCLSILLFVLSPWVGEFIFHKSELIEPLGVMALGIVPLALLTLYASALQGLKRIAASTSVLSVFVPMITCIIVILLVPDYGIYAATWGYLVAVVVTFVIGVFFWRRATSAYKNESSEFSRSELFSSSMPLFVGGMMDMIIIWSPMLILGIWASNQDIGVYNAASKTAMLTSFVLGAVNSISAPKFAMLYAQNDMKALALLARNSAKIMILCALPILLLFMLIPELILSLFGDEFKQGAAVLMVLVVGQFIAVATGSVMFLLMMSGNEKLMRNNLITCACIVVILSLWLIPMYGIVGAAIAAAVTLSVQNLIATILVWRKLHIMIVPWVRWGQ